MVRVVIAAAALSLILAACNGGAEDTTTTAAPTTTQAAPTTTTTEPAPTSTEEATTTTASAVSAFPATPGTPTQLDSYSGTTEMSFAAEGLSMDFVSEGTYVGDAFRCDTTMDVGGFAITAAGIATPETAWVDLGQGFVEVPIFDPDLDTAIGVCPANPLFWVDGAFAIGEVEGEPDTINGIPAQRVELGELLDALSSFGFAALEGVEFQDAVVWIADDGAYVVAFDMSFSVAPESAGEIFGPGFELTEPATMRMVMQIADPNDPTLTVELPGE